MIQYGNLKEDRKDLETIKMLAEGLRIKLHIDIAGEDKGMPINKALNYPLDLIRMACIEVDSIISVASSSQDVNEANRRINNEEAEDDDAD